MNQILRRAAMFAAAVAVSGCVTVEPGQRGIFFKPFSSEPKTNVVSEGTYYTAPWNTLFVYDLRWQTRSEKADVQTSDKLHLVVPTTVAFRARGEKLLTLHQSLGRDFYESTVRPALLTATRSEFAHRTQDEVVPQAASLQKDILEELRERLAPYDIEVASVTFVDLDYPDDLAIAIKKRMVTEQEIRNQDSRIELTRKEAAVNAARQRGEAEARLAAKEIELTIAAKDAEVNATRQRGESEARLASKEAELAIARKEAEMVAVSAQAEAESLKRRLAVPGYLKLRAIEAQQALAASSSSKVMIVAPPGKEGPVLTLHPDLGDARQP